MHEQCLSAAPTPIRQRSLELKFNVGTSLHGMDAEGSKGSILHPARDAEGWSPRHEGREGVRTLRDCLQGNDFRIPAATPFSSSGLRGIF